MGLAGWTREEMSWWVGTMSWFPAEVWRRGGTGGAQARGRGLQGNDVIHGQDQGGGGFRDALTKSSAHPQPAPGRRSWGADCGFLVTALATPGEKKQAKATGGEKSREERSPGFLCGGLGIKRGARVPCAHSPRVASPSAQRHPRPAALTCCSERRLFPSRAGGGGCRAKGTRWWLRKLPPGNQALCAASRPFPISWARIPGLARLRGVQEAPGGLYWGWRVQGARPVGWGGIVWGQREEQDVSDGFAESPVCRFLCPPRLRLSSRRFREASVGGPGCSALLGFRGDQITLFLSRFVSRLSLVIPFISLPNPLPIPSSAFSAPSFWF